MKKFLIFVLFLMTINLYSEGYIIYGDFSQYINEGDYVEDVQKIGEIKNVSKINLIGDSITKGGISGYIDKFAYPYDMRGYLEKMLGIEVVNYAVCGAMLSLPSNQSKPLSYAIKDIEYVENDLTIIACGINDTIASVDINLYANSWNICISNWRKYHKNGGRLIIATILPANNYYIYKNSIGYSDSTNYTFTYSIYNRNAYSSRRSKGDIFLADIEKAVKNGELPNARKSEDNVKYYGNNGLHPNYNGYYELAKWYANFLIDNFGIRY